jgi:hypothetical protein
MDPNNPKILDMGYYNRLNKLSNLCLFAGIWTMVMGIFELTGEESNVLGKVLTTISNVCFLLLCIYAYTAIRRRKPNALFYARFIMAICLLSWIILIASGGFKITGGNIFFGIGTLIYGGLGLYWSFAEDEVKEVFPKEYRKVTWKDYLFCFGCALLPVILAVIFILIVLGASYFNAPNHLKEAVEYANKVTPLEMGYGVISSIKYENNTVSYNQLIDESMVDMNSVEQNKEKWCLLSIKKIATQSDGNLLLEEMVKAKAKFQMINVGNQTGKTTCAICDSRTIKDCLKNSNENGDFAFVETSIEMQKLLLPMKIDEYTTLTDVYLKNMNVNYSYAVNDSDVEDVDIKYLKDCALLDIAASTNQATYSLYTKLADMGYGVEYHYLISGEIVGSYRISSSEIDYALKHPLSEFDYILKYLNATVAKVNRKELPVEIDQGLTLQNIELENVCLIYNYLVDERLIRLDVINENKKELKSSLLESDLQTMIGALTVACNKGISYHFIGNRSKKTVVIDCSYYEINSLMNQ